MFKYSKDRRRFKRVLNKISNHEIRFKTVKYDNSKYMPCDYKYDRESNTLEDVTPTSYARPVGMRISANEFNFIIDGIRTDITDLHGNRYCLVYCYNIDKSRAER